MLVVVSRHIYACKLVYIGSSWINLCNGISVKRLIKNYPVNNDRMVHNFPETFECLPVCLITGNFRKLAN